MPIIDMYDDPDARVLRRHLETTGGGLTQKLAALAPDDTSVLADVPDRLFALVGTHGGVPLRKYAMHDQEHLATSILYFLECGGQLPEDTRAKVAMRLIEGCGWYETAPPLALTKVAVLGAVVNTGIAASQMPSRLRMARMGNQNDEVLFRQAQMGKIATRARSPHTEAEAYKALDDFLRGDEKPEDQASAYGDGYPNYFEDKLKVVKEANTAGTEVHAFGALSDDPRPKTPARRFAISPKVSQAHDVGELEFIGAAPEVETARHYALPHREQYPIDTPEQVKRASAYFDEYARDFTLEDRRMFAQSVALRADALGEPVGNAIAKIAGEGYGPNIVPELKGRITAFEGTGKEASYQVLLENIESTPPIVMFDMLKIADEETGVDNGYGRPVTGFKDPLSAVFGAPEKPIYTWCARGAYVTEEQLRSFSKLVPDLDKVIEKDFSVKFIDDPIKSFDKLPDAKKIIMARLANGEAFRWM